jgi:hypothetical protein
MAAHGGWRATEANRRALAEKLGVDWGADGREVELQ